MLRGVCEPTCALALQPSLDHTRAVHGASERDSVADGTALRPAA
jgi:hypothetical protein